MKKLMTVTLFALACLSLLAACGGDGKPDNGGNKPTGKPKSDGTLRLPVPEEFKAKQPPRPLTDAAFIEVGKKLFHDPAKANCLMCHGDGGKGDGPQAPTYNDPSVADLTNPTFQDAVTDQYMFWRIAKPTDSRAYPNSGMLGYPAGSEEDWWSLVAYVRSLKGK